MGFRILYQSGGAAGFEITATAGTEVEDTSDHIPVTITSTSGGDEWVLVELLDSADAALVDSAAFNLAMGAAGVALSGEDEARLYVQLDAGQAVVNVVDVSGTAAGDPLLLQVTAIGFVAGPVLAVIEFTEPEP